MPLPTPLVLADQVEQDSANPGKKGGLGVIAVDAGQGSGDCLLGDALGLIHVADEEGGQADQAGPMPLGEHGERLGLAGFDAGGQLIVGRLGFGLGPLMAWRIPRKGRRNPARCSMLG